MKKLLVVLLSLGLIAAFSMNASAADVKFSGSYYIAGVYENNRRLADTDQAFSRAFIYQRIRIQPEFQIAEGLSLTTRLDVLEKQWGQTDWRGGFDDKLSSRRETVGVAGGNPRIQESIEFEWGYMTFKTAVGQFEVGMKQSGKWGTRLGDDSQTRPGIDYRTGFGPVTILASYEKLFDADTSSQAGYAGKVDADVDTYALAALYKFKAGTAGLRYKYYNYAMNRTKAVPYRSKISEVSPYLMATFGPVYVESELMYLFGKAKEFEGAGAPATGDVDAAGWAGYLMARMNLGPAYVGGRIVYVSGDDGTDPTKDKTGSAVAPSHSNDLNTTLILGSDDMQTRANGSLGGANGATRDSSKINTLLYNMFAGYNPTAKLNIEAGITMATADKKPVGYVSDKYGTEFDITAKYKIYDNLEYMIGAGYLWTGDYFKGNSTANKIGDDYLLMNELTLKF
jgi:hypothetical protein